MDEPIEQSVGQPAAEGTVKGKLQLPASCDPPQLDAPRKQLVWVVSFVDG